MSRRSLFLVPLALAVVVTAGLLATPAQAGGNINALLGQREMDESFSDTEDIQEQDMLGLMMDWGAEGWPINIALDIVAGSKDTNDENFDVNVDGSTLAIDGGVRWYFVKNRSWEPYVGGGVAYISGEVDTSGENNDLEFDDSTIGYWLNGGIKWVIGEHFNLGGDIRWEKAELDVEDDLGNPTDVEAGGLGYAVLLGYRW
ncbi:MAG TPA: outer membrane beta-barrel protein [Candidatus Polarisedimenticolaceae bacterium]|nr:outer membrane beta-barrel protein [Candidatus Polarisedimenticolaceae bacterium]